MHSDAPCILAPQVYQEQVNATSSSKGWRDRKSTVAVCDEIGMENIPVTKLHKKKAKKLMPDLDADAQLYGNTICARLGWQTDCFQVLDADPKKNCVSVS